MKEFEIWSPLVSLWHRIAEQTFINSQPKASTRMQIDVDYQSLLSSTCLWRSEFFMIVLLSAASHLPSGSKIVECKCTVKIIVSMLAELTLCSLMLTADFAIGEVGTAHFGIQSSLHRHIWCNIAVISLTAKSNVLLSLLVAANWSGVPLCPCKLTAWASGAGMGRLVSHWGRPGGWAVGRCRLSAGAPVVR